MTEDEWRAKEYQDSRPKGCLSVLVGVGAVVVAMLRLAGRVTK